MARGLTAGSDDYNRGFRRIAFSLIALVVVPTALLLAVGVVMLVFYDLQANLAFGLLVVTLVGHPALTADRIYGYSEDNEGHVT